MPFFRRSGNARARSALKNQKSFGWKNSMAVSQIGRSANMKRAIDNRVVCCNPIIKEVIEELFGVIRDMVIDSSNNIIIVGSEYKTDVFTNILLAKFNTDSTLDTSFGADGNGIVITEISPTEISTGYGIVLDSNDNIFISGFAQQNIANLVEAEKTNFIIAKYLSNGQLDTSWQTNGYNIIPNFLYTGDAKSYSLRIDNDDKIILVGYGYGTNNWVFKIIKLDTNGNLDTTFAGSLVHPHPDLRGIITLSSSKSPNSSFNDVAIDNSNNIIVVGQFMDVSGVWNYKKIIMRITPDGNFDTTFNNGLALGDAPPPFNNGWNPVPLVGGLIIIDDDPAAGGANQETLNAINVLPDNSIVTSGFDVSGGQATFYIAHIDAAGTTINKRGFAEGGAGFVIPFSKAQSQVMIDNSHCIVAGVTVNLLYPAVNDFDFALAKYDITTNPPSLDASFGTLGIVSTDIFNATKEDVAYTIKEDNSNNIVVGGYSVKSGDPKPNMAIVKYDSVGTVIWENVITQK